MQSVALIVAIAFGVWAIKSYIAAQDANEMAQEANALAQAANTLAQNSLKLGLLANQIALISYCGAVGQVSGCIQPDRYGRY
jgi:hypothetical protein